MGRQYYLHRMALGRSAYEPRGAIMPPATEDETSNDHYVQQYDSKGNPFNPATSEFNGAMRDAQNEALLLTGVVQRKEKSDRAEERQRSRSRARRDRLLIEEQEMGESLDYLLVPVHFFSHIWMEAIIKRIQIGAYPSSLSILTIINAESGTIMQPNQPIRLTLARRFPAVGDTISQFLIRIPLVVIVEQITGRLQSYIQRKRLSRKTSRRLYTAISLAFEATLILIDLALLPTEFYTTAQTLSLVPALPLFPPWKFFYPWSSTSFHTFGWRRISYIFSSPAVLLSISRLLRCETSGEGFPISSFFTSFRWPELTDDPSLVPKPRLGNDPLGWAMYQSWSLRTKILHSLGWRIVKLNPRIPAERDLENDMLLDEHNQLVPTTGIHRSTALAHAPAQVLANGIDAVFRKIALLPFESLMLRSVAFAITGPQLSGPGSAGRSLYAPFGGPLSRIGKPGVLAELGAYASRLGLGILLNASLDVALFFGVYQCVRRLGREKYEWGAEDEIRRRQREERRMEAIFEEDNNTIID